MCQAFEGENRVVAACEKNRLIKLIEDHEAGNITLTQEEINEIAVRLFILADT